jgi:hypothetical protein
MEKRKIVLALLTIVMLLTITVASAAASVRTSGVNAGDTATYGNANFSWYSSDPSATPPAEWDNLNGTAWFRGTVDSVVGTNVTISSLAHYNNGTEKTQDGWLDVDTGDGENMTFFLISANLNAGDSVYSGGTYSTWIINETIPGTRQTNHLNITMDESFPPYTIYMSMNYYWDKATGILTKISIISNQTTTSTTDWSISFELTASNKFTVPEFVGLPEILLLLAPLTLVTLAHRRKLHKTQNL